MGKRRTSQRASDIDPLARRAEVSGSGSRHGRRDPPGVAAGGVERTAGEDRGDVRTLGADIRGEGDVIGRMLPLRDGAAGAAERGTDRIDGAGLRKDGVRDTGGRETLPLL